MVYLYSSPFERKNVWALLFLAVKIANKIYFNRKIGHKYTLSEAGYEDFICFVGIKK